MLSAGSPIELETSIDGVLNWFGGTIERSAPEALALRFPNRGNPRPFPVGSDVHIDVIERGEVASFDSTVLAMMTTAESLVVEVRPPDSYKTLGRSFFRLAWRVPITINWEGGCDGLTVETEDVGAGGVGVVVLQQVDVGRRATVTLHLGGRGDIDICAWVVRAHQVALTEPPRFRIGLVFEDITTKTRDRLIGFIFEKQREIRRRELDQV